MKKELVPEDSKKPPLSTSPPIPPKPSVSIKKKVLQKKSIATSNIIPLQNNQPIQQLSDELSGLRRAQSQFLNVDVDTIDYIALRGSYKENSESDIDLNDAVQKFLDDGNKRRLLLIGRFASGKTVFTQKLVLKLWQSLKEEDLVPLWISLPSSKNCRARIIEETLKKYGFTIEHIELMRVKRKFLFIFDAYDEFESAENIWNTNQLVRWNGKCIFTCRHEYLRFWDNFVTLFSPEAQLNDPEMLVLYINPLTLENIRQYAKRSIKNSVITESNLESALRHFMALPGIQELIKVPFILRCALENYTRILSYNHHEDTHHQLEDVSAQLFEVLIRNILERQERKLRESGYVPGNESAQDQRAHLESFARLMHQERLLSVSYIQNSNQDYFSDIFDNEETFDEDPFAELFERTAPDKSWFLTACLFNRIADERYSFLDIEMIIYFATGTFGNETIPLELPVAPNAHDKSERDVARLRAANKEFNLQLHTENLIKNNADLISSEYEVREYYLERLRLSRNCPEFAVASSNALSALVRARVPLNGADLSYLYLMRGNYTGGYFDRANFEGSDLSHAKMYNVWLRQGNMRGCNLRGVDLGVRPRFLYEDEVNAIIYQEHLNRLIIAAGKKILVWDLAQKKNIKILDGHTEKVTSLSVSNNGEIIASGSEDKSVRVWDLVNDKTTVLTGHLKKVSAVCLSYDAKTLYSGSWDYTLRIWDIPSRKSKVLVGHDNIITCICLSKNQDFLYSGSHDETIRMWKIGTESLSKVWAHDGPVACFYLRDQNTIISGSTSGGVYELILFEKKTEKRAENASEENQTKRKSAQAQQDEEKQNPSLLYRHNGPVTCISTSLDTNVVISGGEDRSILIRTAEGNNVNIKKFTGHDKSILCLSSVDKSNSIYSGSSDKSLRQWDITVSSTTQLQHEIVKLVGFLESEQKIALFKNKNLYYFDINTFQSENQKNINDAMEVIGISLDMRVVLYRSLDDRLCVFDLIDAISTSLDDYQMGNSCLGMSANAEIIAYKAKDNTIKKWDRRSGEITKFLSTSMIKCIGVSANGEKVVAGCLDKSVRQWETETGTSKLLYSHSYEVACVSTSTDGEIVVSGDTDKSIFYCDISEGKLVSVLGHENAINCVRISFDKTTLVSGSDDKTLRIWKIHSDSQGIKISISAIINLNVEVKNLSLCQDSRWLAIELSDTSVQLYERKDKLGQEWLLKWSSKEANPTIHLAECDLTGALGLSEINREVFTQGKALLNADAERTQNNTSPDTRTLKIVDMDDLRATVSKQPVLLPIEQVRQQRLLLIRKVQALGIGLASFPKALSQVVEYLSRLKNSNDQVIAKLRLCISTLKSPEELFNIATIKQLYESLNNENEKQLLKKLYDVIAELEKYINELQYINPTLVAFIDRLRNIFSYFKKSLLSGSVVERKKMFITPPYMVGECIDFSFLKKNSTMTGLSYNAYNLGLMPDNEASVQDDEVIYTSLIGTNEVKTTTPQLGMEYAVFALLQLIAGECCVVTPASWIKIKGSKGHIEPDNYTRNNEGIVRAQLGVHGRTFRDLLVLIDIMKKFVSTTNLTDASSIMNLILNADMKCRKLLQKYSSTLKQFENEKEKGQGSQVSRGSPNKNIGLALRAVAEEIPDDRMKLLSKKYSGDFEKYLRHSVSETTALRIIAILPDILKIAPTQSIDILFEITSYLDLIKDLLPYATTDEVIQYLPDFLSRWDMKQFGFSVIGHLLVRPSCAGPDDFQMRYTRDPRTQAVTSFELINVKPSETYFSSMVSPSQTTANSKMSRIGVVDLLFLMKDHLEKPIVKEVRERLLSQLPIYWVLDWAVLLYEYSQRCQELAKKNVIRMPESNMLSEHSAELRIEMSIHIRISIEIFPQLLRDLTEIRNLLLSKNKATHYDIILCVKRILYRFYKKVADTDDSTLLNYLKLSSTFDNIFGSDISDIPNWEVSTSESPSITVEDAIVNFIDSISWSELSTTEQSRLLAELASRFSGLKILYKSDVKWLNSKLLNAAEEGNSEVVRLVLQAGANVNSTESGQTALHKVLSQENNLSDDSILSTVAVLINASGIKVNCYDQFGGSPLLYLIVRFTQKRFFLIEKVIDLLILRRVDFNSTDDKGVSLLDRTINDNHPDLFALLIKKGAGARCNVQNVLSFIQKYLSYANYKNLMLEVQEILMRRNDELYYKLFLSVFFSPKKQYKSISMLGDEHGNLYPKGKYAADFIDVLGIVSDRRVKFSGRRKVVSFDVNENGFDFFVDIKENSPFSNYELPARAFRRQLICHGSPYVEVFECLVESGKKKCFPLKFFTPIKGDNLFDVLESTELSSMVLNKLDHRSMSEMIITTIIISPGNEQPEQFVAEPIQTTEGERYRLECVEDNDGFVEPVIQDSQNKPQLQLLSILLCFDNMMHTLHPDVVDHFIELKSEQVLREWLRKLVERRQNLDEGISQRPITVSSDLVPILYERLRLIKKALRKNPCNITGMQLLKSVMPIVGTFYEESFRIHHTPQHRFKELKFGGHLRKFVASRAPAYESVIFQTGIVSLTDQSSSGRETQIDLQKAIEVLAEIDSSEKRMDKILSELMTGNFEGFKQLNSPDQKEKVFNRVDWQELKKNSKLQRSILQFACSLKIPFRRLKLAYCTELTRDQLIVLLKQSPKITRLDLSCCPLVNDAIIQDIEKHAKRLEVLKLQGTRLIIFSTNSLPCLQKLILEDCLELVRIVVTDGRIGTHQTFTTLYLERSTRISEIDIQSSAFTTVSCEGMDESFFLRILAQTKKLHRTIKVSFEKILTQRSEKRAILDFQFNNYSMALEHCKKALLYNKDNTEVLALSGKIYMLQNEYQKALNAFVLIRKIDPDNNKILFELGLCQYFLCDYSNAKATFTLFLKKFPHNIDATIYLVESRLSLDKLESSLNDLTDLIKRVPDNYRLYLLRAKCFLAEDEYGKCLDDVKSAEKLNDSDPDMYDSFALVYFKIGLIGNSLAACERAFSLGGKSLRTLLIKVKCLRILGQYLDAGMIMGSALFAGKADESPGYLNEFSRISLALNNLDAAERQSRKALAVLDNQDIDSQITFAKILILKKKYDVATRRFDSIIKQLTANTNQSPIKTRLDRNDPVSRPFSLLICYCYKVISLLLMNLLNDAEACYEEAYKFMHFNDILKDENQISRLIASGRLLEIENLPRMREDSVEQLITASCLYCSVGVLIKFADFRRIVPSDDKDERFQLKFLVESVILSFELIYLIKRYKFIHVSSEIRDFLTLVLKSHGYQEQVHDWFTDSDIFDRSGAEYISDILESDPRIIEYGFDFRLRSLCLLRRTSIAEELFRSDSEPFIKVAAICGSEKIVNSLLQELTDINRDLAIRDALGCYAFGGHQNCINGLVEVFGEPNIVTVRLMAYMAAVGGHVDILKYLNTKYDFNLNYIYPPTARCQEPKTLLIAAIIGGNNEMIEFLRQAEHGIDASIGLGLHRYASRAGHWFLYEQLEPNNGKVANIEEAVSIAQDAVRMGRIDLLLNIMDSHRFSETVLTESILIGGNIDMFNFALSKKWFSLTDQFSGGASVQHIVVRGGHLELLKVVLTQLNLQNASDPYVRDDRGRTLLHEAAEGGHSRVYFFLVEQYYRDRPLPIDNDGNTVAHSGARSGSAWFLMKLFNTNNGTELFQSTNSNGETILFPAIYTGELNYIILLVEKFNVDIKSADRFGKTILSKLQELARNDPSYRAFAETLLKRYFGELAYKFEESKAESVADSSPDSEQKTLTQTRSSQLPMSSPTKLPARPLPIVVKEVGEPVLEQVRVGRKRTVRVLPNLQELTSLMDNSKTSTPFLCMRGQVYARVVNELPSVNDAIRLTSCSSTFWFEGRVSVFFRFLREYSPMNNANSFSFLKDIIEMESIFGRQAIDYKKLAIVITKLDFLIDNIFRNRLDCPIIISALCASDRLISFIRDAGNFDQDNHWLLALPFFSLTGRIYNIKMSISMYCENKIDIITFKCMVIMAAIQNEFSTLEYLRSTNDFIAITNPENEGYQSINNRLYQVLVENHSKICVLLESCGDGLKEFVMSCFDADRTFVVQDANKNKSTRYSEVNAANIALVGGDKIKIKNPLRAVRGAITIGNLTLTLRLIAQYEINPKILASYVVKCGHAQIFNFALDNGWFKLTDSLGSSIQHILAREGHLDLLKQVLQDSRALKAIHKRGKATDKPRAAYIVDHQGRSLLHAAAAREHTEIYFYLVRQYYQNRSLPCDNHGNTVAHSAASAGSIWFLKRLYTVPGGPELLQTRNNNEESILFSAARCCDAKLLIIIIEEFRIDPKSQDIFGNTLLHLCANFANGDPDYWLIIEKIVKRYPDQKLLDIPTKQGKKMTVRDMIIDAKRDSLLSGILMEPIKNQGLK